MRSKWQDGCEACRWIKGLKDVNDGFSLRLFLSALPFRLLFFFFLATKHNAHWACNGSEGSHSLHGLHGTKGSTGIAVLEMCYFCMALILHVDVIYLNRTMATAQSHQKIMATFWHLGISSSFLFFSFTLSILLFSSRLPFSPSSLSPLPPPFGSYCSLPSSTPLFLFFFFLFFTSLFFLLFTVSVPFPVTTRPLHSPLPTTPSLIPHSPFLTGNHTNTYTRPCPKNPKGTLLPLLLPPSHTFPNHPSHTSPLHQTLFFSLFDAPFSLTSCLPLTSDMSNNNKKKVCSKLFFALPQTHLRCPTHLPRLPFTTPFCFVMIHSLSWGRGLVLGGKLAAVVVKITKWRKQQQ